MVDARSMGASSVPQKRRVPQQFKRGEVHVERAMQRVLRHLVFKVAGGPLHSKDFPAAAGIGAGNVLQIRNALMGHGLIEITPASRDPADWYCAITPRGRMRAGGSS